jgi:hypothetical protein
VHQLGLRQFGAMVWEPLIIETFFQSKLNQIEIEICNGIWGCSWHSWNALSVSQI